MKTRTIFLITLLVGSMFLIACQESTKYDEFAKCITESGAKMYGAYWCPHCIAQKEFFGGSIDHVNYIECSLPRRSGVTAICTQEGIEGYPTWEMPDGQRVSGGDTPPLALLVQTTGCELPQDE